MGTLSDLIDTTLSRFKIVDNAYLKPRGMLISDLPKVVKEIEKDITDKEKILINLSQKRVDLIEKFEEERANRKEYSIDALVNAFAITNSVLSHKFPIKD